MLRQLVLLAFLAPIAVHAQSLASLPPVAQGLLVGEMSQTQLEVHSAVEDYLLGFYDAEPSRLERCLHPELQKVGYWRDGDGAYHYATMSYDQALELAARWNANGDQTDADSPREISLIEVNDQTAIAKLHAVWGVDFFQLGRYDGEWKIINVIWQSVPMPDGN